MDEANDARVSTIMKHVADEARKVLYVEKRRDFANIRVHLYNTAWSHYDGAYDSPVAFKNVVIPEAKNVIDAWIASAAEEPNPH